MLQRIVMGANRENLELFDQLANTYIKQQDQYYAAHANSMQSADQLKDIDRLKILDELKVKIPRLLSEVIECLKLRLPYHNGSREPLALFLEKIDPKAILDSYSINQYLLPKEEKLYKFYNIKDQEFSIVLGEGREMIEEGLGKEASNLFYILTLLDNQNLDAWMGLGMALFSVGLSDDNQSQDSFERALNAFWRAHILDPSNIVPPIAMIESLIQLHRYQDAYKIVQEIVGEKLDHKVEEILNILNQEIKQKV